MSFEYWKLLFSGYLGGDLPGSSYIVCGSWAVGRACILLLNRGGSNPMVLKQYK